MAAPRHPDDALGTHVIEATDLRKSYGEVEALRGVSFSVSRGEVVGLLGPNGAGKTTAMKILAGYLLPDAGSARIAGHDVLAEPRAVQARIGYLPENAPLYHDMLAQEQLLFLAAMRGLEGDTARQRIANAAEECGIREVLTRPIGHLSKGYRQRVGLAGAILHDPEILILDEPTTGLDPNQIVEIRDLIRRMGRTKTILLSTHILPEVEVTCARVIMILDGRIGVDGKLADLTRTDAVLVRVAAPDPAAARALFAAVPGVVSVAGGAERDGFAAYRLELAPGAEIADDLWHALAQRGWRVREMRREARTLEQVFRELTERPAEVPA